jgi:enterochelin esterase-like enzyme
MLHWLESLTLTDGPLHFILLGGVIAGIALLLSVRRDRRWWLLWVPLAAVAASIPALAFRQWVIQAKPWPDGIPFQVVAWLAVGLLGPALLVAGWPRRRWRMRLLSAAAAVLTVLGASDAIDTVFGSYPTVATALQLPPQDTVTASSILQANAVSLRRSAAPGAPAWEGWTPPPDMPHHGAVIQVHIPPTHSGFSARDAWVYLPPAYLSSRRPLLPLLVALSGDPGTPRDWLDGGQLAQVMDQWTAAHQGLGPVVVMPDWLGSVTANPLCMDSALGRDDTYLARDVPEWAVSALQVDPVRTRWAVAGFSSGGTCALQLAVAHPALFRTFIDMSGQREPTLGGRSRTVAATFHGNQAAFIAVDPLHEMARHRYPDTAGVVAVGAQDGWFLQDSRLVAAATRSAGMSITYRTPPGQHSWFAWRAAFTQSLPWLAVRMGLAAP